MPCVQWKRIVVTTSDYESWRPGSSPALVPIYLARSLHMTHPSLYLSGVVHRYQNSWTKKLLLGHVDCFDGCSLRCVRPYLQWHHLAYATIIKSILLPWASGGGARGVNAPPRFCKHLVKILTFCVTILTFCQNTITNIFKLWTFCTHACFQSPR